ncbi:PstS family phosphate ABC transporter substrate-binding protein [Amycolatopsis sp. GM8]|uniref:PstS family phosphate ABC transporter substrate-binding protein n=1 Tax=Amycolatopsis sp. GM8 TaxID=2896530 RepID=UPI001F1A519C|nr:substrate-binding domain-containing protein [Amycolatopsis sp. GM8]
MPDSDQKTDLTRDLYAAAYPEQDPSWIDGQVALAERRITRAKEAEPSTSAGARQLSAAVINRAAPVRRRGPRIAASAGLAVVAVVALVLGITERRWVAEAAISPVGINGLLIATVVAGVAALISYVRSRRRRILSCRVRIDAPFEVDVGETVRLEGERAAVADPGVVVARIKNTGGAQITATDYVSPLALHFPGRKVISFDATEFEGDKLPNVFHDLLEQDDFEPIQGDRVELPLIGLERGDSFKLVIVLSGTKVGKKHQIAVEGGLRDGLITTREGRERIRPDTLFWGSLTALCAGALAVVLLLNNVVPFTKLPQGVICVPGSLAAEGSSAFGRAATELAGSYHAYCPESSIKIRTPGSLEGLRRLADTTNPRGQLALSDGRVDDPQFSQLVPSRLAIVPFTFVVSANVPISTLSVADARRIFTGTARVWSDITGNPRDTKEIRVVGRSASSGTRRTLENYVLGTPGAPLAQATATSDSCRDRRPGTPTTKPIVCEQGSTADLTDQVGSQDDAIGYADVSDVEQSTGVKQISLDGRTATLEDIRAGYPFWTVEYVYSRGLPDAGSLAAAFKTYLLTPEGRSTMEGFQYYACIDDLQDVCARR